MARVLVTGGAGFIGSNLTEALLKEGNFVRVLDDFSTGKRENLDFDGIETAFEVIEGSVCDMKLCRAAVEGMEYVFHQAALPSVPKSIEDPLTSNAVNIGGTLNLLLAARDAGVRRVIYASSSSVYGDTPILPKKEEMPPNPLSPYALQKYAGEQYCRLFSELYGLETASLRYFNVYGPRQNPHSVYAAVIPSFIQAFLEGRRPVVYGDGEQSRDFTFVENVVRANILAMKAERLTGEVINIGCGKRTTLNQILSILAEIFEVRISPIYTEPRRGDIRHSMADIARGREILNFHPDDDLELGLKKTVEYFRAKRARR